jgi:hypothetical protein
MKHLLLLATAALTLFGADATGTWTGTLTPAGDPEAKPARLVLKQDGTTLTGTAGPDAGEQHAIRNGRAESDTLTFQVAQGEGVMKFALKIAGDEIKGDISRQRGDQTQTAKLSVKREK